MNKAIILHGTLGSPQGNWFRWLEVALKDCGFEVWLPELPHADQPSLAEWSDFVRKQCPFSLDKDTIIVGHSSGAALALILTQQNPEPLGAIVLVSVFDDNSLQWEPDNGLFDIAFDYATIRTHANNMLFVHSDNDPYVPLPQAERIAKACGSAVHLLPSQGHFNLELSDSYREFPEFLELMKYRKILA